MYVSLCTNTWP